MKRVIALTVLAAGLTALPALATTVAYVPLARSIEMSEQVLVGHVLGLEAAYNAEGEIVTEVSLLVEETFKGAARPGETITFHAWGGSLDGVTVETVGEARYRLGDKVLVQLEDIDGEYHTLGLSFGKWNVVRGKDGSSWIARTLDDLNVVGVTEQPVVKMPLSRMRDSVRQHRHAY